MYCINYFVVHKLLYIVYTHNLVRNCIIILSGKKEELRNDDAQL
jgi:hypothetical protein